YLKKRLSASLFSPKTGPAPEQRPAALSSPPYRIVSRGIRNSKQISCAARNADKGSTASGHRQHSSFHFIRQMWYYADY
ncbi:MAG TPA: hypothetical protein VLR45_08980, partial [Desulfoprunum sp.]|nr:hypothetical protein [Desulfoprunum sp.]